LNASCDGEIDSIADKISSFGDVAISSSRGVIWIIFAGGTAFRIVPFGVVPLGFFAAVDTGALFLLIQLFCLSVNCLGFLIASCAMNGGVGSGVSVPLLLKIEILRLAIAFGSGLKSVSISPKAVPSRDANCASKAMLATVGKLPLSE
jgi:hypothetical protein